MLGKVCFVGVSTYKIAARILNILLLNEINIYSNCLYT